MATRERPVSPFMIGPYYRPQLTSMLSIIFRAAGVLLSVGALVVAAWLVALAFDADLYVRIAGALGTMLGQAFLMAMAAALVYHFLNGLRHLAWDAGWGYEIPKAYASGYAVVVLTIVFTAVLWWFGLGGRP